MTSVTAPDALTGRSAKVGREGRREVVLRHGATETLGEFVAARRARRCLVVASPGTLRRVPVMALLGSVETALFQDFTPNPRLEQALRGTTLVEQFQPDVIVAVGGGSTLDIAKLIRALPSDGTVARRALEGETRALRLRPVPLVSLPTTAGTGSEVTSFATVFIGKRKHSLDHPRARPEVALVDPLNTVSCPPGLTASCALDALAHAVESYWSVRSTSYSRVLAQSALSDLLPVLRCGVESPTLEERTSLARAALAAGLAIDLTRTTAAHACAYPTTAHFGVPHGLACALHLVWLLPATAALAGHECRDARGACYVRRRIHQICDLFGVDGPEDAGEMLAGLIRRAGLPDRLLGHGIGPGDLAMLVQESLSSVRAGNHPVRLVPDVARRWMRTRL